MRSCSCCLRAGGLPLGVKAPPRTGEPLDRWRGREARPVFLCEPLQRRVNFGKADVVGVPEQSAAEWRKPGAEDHREVELLGPRDDPLLEAVRRLVDHRKDEPVLDLLGCEGRSLLRLDAQRGVRLLRWVAPLAVFVVVEALPGLAPEA